MNFWVAIYKFAWIMLGVLCLAIVVVFFTPKFRSQGEMQRKLTELREENRKLQDQINELISNQERFKSDPEFVERTAKGLGYARTNETVVKFDNERSTSPNAAN